MPSAERQAVATALHSACIHLLRRVREVDDACGLSAARLSALSVLVFGGPATVGQLAQAERVRSPTMTALVTQLEADGLVRRTTPDDRADRRQVVVEATPRGVKLMQRAQRMRLDLLESLLDEVATADDIRVLRRTARLLEAMAATAAGSPTPAGAGTPGRSTPPTSRPSAGTARRPARGRRSS
jgi:DNA-binding MarR family transcriptional regulator